MEFCRRRPSSSLHPCIRDCKEVITCHNKSLRMVSICSRIRCFESGTFSSPFLAHFSYFGKTKRGLQNYLAVLCVFPELLVYIYLRISLALMFMYFKKTRTLNAYSHYTEKCLKAFVCLFRQIFTILRNDSTKLVGTHKFQDNTFYVMIRQKAVYFFMLENL